MFLYLVELLNCWIVRKARPKDVPILSSINKHNFLFVIPCPGSASLPSAVWEKWDIGSESAHLLILPRWQTGALAKLRLQAFRDFLIYTLWYRIIQRLNSSTNDCLRWIKLPEGIKSITHTQITAPEKKSFSASTSSQKHNLLRPVNWFVIAKQVLF